MKWGTLLCLGLCLAHACLAFEGNDKRTRDFNSETFVLFPKVAASGLAIGALWLATVTLILFPIFFFFCQKHRNSSYGEYSTISYLEESLQQAFGRPEVNKRSNVPKREGGYPNDRIWPGGFLKSETSMTSQSQVVLEALNDPETAGGQPVQLCAGGCGGNYGLLAVNYCVHCKIQICYLCAETCADDGHRLLGGVDGIDCLEWSKDKKAKALNAGAECVLHLDRLHCPCGVRFIDGHEAAICCACGTATCSEDCHKLYVQDKHKCLYPKNYLPFIAESKQGFRCLQQQDIVGAPEGTYLSYECGPRFIEAEVIDDHRLKFRRGYAQYGDPVEETLHALEVVDTHQVARPSNARNLMRRCLCNCDSCSRQANHPARSCWCNL